jgi:hypothetical protein
MPLEERYWRFRRTSMYIPSTFRNDDRSTAWSLLEQETLNVTDPVAGGFVERTRSSDVQSWIASNLRREGTRCVISATSYGD